jgi:hypothetical protein
MQLIQHQELTSAAASITFSSIPQTFTDLYVLISGRTDLANVATNPKIYPNGSSSNLSYRYLRGNGSNSESGTIYLGFANSATSTANTFGNWGFYIPNYTSSIAKSISSDSVAENNATSGFLAISAILWNDTSAITSLEIVGQSTDEWQIGTSATLYGVLAGSDGIVAVS